MGASSEAPAPAQEEAAEASVVYFNAELAQAKADAAAARRAAKLDYEASQR